MKEDSVEHVTIRTDSPAGSRDAYLHTDTVSDDQEQASLMSTLSPALILIAIMLKGTPDAGPYAMGALGVLGRSALALRMQGQLGLLLG
ncbi:Protein of unknown function [Pyronema omphalodes CBS 100304]|uniref:Uncharacterized protein n=1 Tax=Pyronema omphalodes (strain CBS 100304) TaxID=1076935 RepID=U4LEC8_PYROM|nr:Protein of unknown function [Pyronema omphalodes CBS 100304]